MKVFSKLYSQISRHLPTTMPVFRINRFESDLEASMNDSCEIFAKHNPSGLPGIDGNNISIVILDFQRIGMTKRFVTSIPENFMGEVIVFSQGNNESHTQLLTEFLLRYPKVRLITSPFNHGIAVGRNRAFQKTTKDWILSLDNDVFFEEDPFQEIDLIVRRTACLFANLSLSLPNGEVYSYGASINSWKRGQITHIEMSSSLNPKSKYDSFFFESTAVMGAACLLHKATFFELGGYDEGYFIGFEDLDFSIRVFLSGRKILNSTNIYLCHDHGIPRNDIEIEYEKNRHSHKEIIKSAKLLEDKYGVVVWDQRLENWLSRRIEKLGIDKV